MKALVRAESLADISAIRLVAELAFDDAENPNNSEPLIIEALRQAGALSLSLVAEYRSAIIGHIAISPVTMTTDVPGWFALGPLSVRPDLQKRGVGSDLVKEALRMLKEHGAAGCVVLGEPKFYQRFGFRPEPGLILHGIQPDLFQAITFVGRAPFGIVSYHPAFYAG
jgi:putative acetyltransferase